MKWKAQHLTVLFLSFLETLYRTIMSDLPYICSLSQTLLIKMFCLRNIFPPKRRTRFISSATENIIVEVPQKMQISACSVTLACNGISIIIFTRPSLARGVLQAPSFLIKSVSQSFILSGNIFSTPSLSSQRARELKF